MRLAFRFPAHPLQFLVVAALAVGSVALVHVGSPASPPRQNQQKLTVEPEPSYRPDAVSVRRHPEVDTDVFLYINHGRNSAPRIGHGGLIERDILTPGDPLHPPKKGAVLKYIKSYVSA